MSQMGYKGERRAGFGSCRLEVSPLGMTLSSCAGTAGRRWDQTLQFTCEIRETI